MVANAKIIFEAVFDSEKNLEAIEEKLGGVGEAATNAFTKAEGAIAGVGEEAVATGEDLVEAFLQDIGLRDLQKDLADTKAGLEKASEGTDELGKALKTTALRVGLVVAAYAGGRWLVGMAKDSIKAARAAGAGEKEFSEWEEAAQRLQISIGTGLVNKIKTVLPLVTELANLSADAGDVFNRLSGLTKEEGEELNITASAVGQLVFAYDTLTGEQLSNEEILRRLNRTTTEYLLLVRRASERVHDFGREVAVSLGDPVQAATDRLTEMGMALGIRPRSLARTLAMAEAEAEAFATGLDVLRASFFPLTEATEDFRESISDLTAEGIALGEEFGLLEFLTPEQQTQIGDLKSELTGVWIGYRDVLELIEDGDLGARGLEEAEVKAEDLRTQIGFLEADIINLGGIPYVTQQQAQDARDRIGDIEGEIDDITAAWEEQTNTMIFNMAAQAVAMTDLPWQEQMDFLNQLAGPEGLGLVDAEMTVFTSNMLTALSRIDEDWKIALQDVLDYAAELRNVDGSISRATVITTFLNLEAGVGSGGGDPDEEPPDEETTTGLPPGVTQTETGTFLTVDQPMFVDSVPITIVTNDPLKAADAVIDVLGKLGSS